MCSKNFCVQAKGGPSPSAPPPKYATDQYHGSIVLNMIPYQHYNRDNLVIIVW